MGAGENRTRHHDRSVEWVERRVCSSPRNSSSSAGTCGGIRSTASGTASTTARRTPYSWSAPCTVAVRHGANSVVDVALVAEQRRRDLDVGHGRRPAERRRPLHRQLGDHRERVGGVLVRRQRDLVAQTPGQRDRVPDVGSRAPEERAGGLPGHEVAGPVGAPACGGGQVHARRQVGLLAGKVVELGRRRTGRWAWWSATARPWLRSKP